MDSTAAVANVTRQAVAFRHSQAAMAAALAAEFHGERISDTGGAAIIPDAPRQGIGVARFNAQRRSRPQLVGSAQMRNDLISVESRGYVPPAGKYVKKLTRVSVWISGR